MERNLSPEKRIADLTVAVATLDRPEDLRGCLEAILANTVSPAELIVVDQSDNQSARPVVEAICEQSFRVIYLPMTRRGLSASRNAAIQRAGQSNLVFTDDDCTPDSQWIEVMDRVLSYSPFPAAVCGRVLPAGPDLPDLFSVSPRESQTRLTYRGKFIPWQVGTGANFAIRQTWLAQIGPFDERLGAGAPGKAAEDADLIFRLLRKGGDILFEPDSLIFHKRQDISKRLSSRFSYGYGIGAFCGIWLRRLDAYVFYALFAWLFGLIRESAGNLVKGKWLEVRQRWMSLYGTLRGLAYGLFARQVTA